MKKILVIFILTGCIKLVIGQNLVPNYSFENMDTCPDNTALIHLAQPWFQPTMGTADYLHSCSYPEVLGVPSNFWGDENAKTGSAYAGLILMFNLPYAYDTAGSYKNYREYIEVELLSPLVTGQKYFVSFYISLGDSVNYGTDDVGAYFSIDTLQNDTSFYNLPVTPQVQNTSGVFLDNKSGWDRVSGSFIAVGGEKFMTIGNFKDYDNTDSMIVAGGVTNNPGQSDWSTGYYYIDDVCVSTDSLTCSPEIGLEDYHPNNLKLYPNPTYFNAILEFNNPDNDGHTLKLFNHQGQLIKTINDIYSDKFEITRNNLPSGLYYFQLWTDRNVVGTGRLIFE